MLVPTGRVDEDDADARRPRRRRRGHRRRRRRRGGSPTAADRARTRCATALEEAGITVESAELTMVPSTTDRRSTTAEDGQEGAAPDRRPRGPRRRPGRLRQLRHPRRRSSRRSRPDVAARRSGDAGARLHAGRHRRHRRGRRDYSLAEYRGRPVVLVFYPGDNTPVCTAAQQLHRGHRRRSASVGAQVLAISPQSVESHERLRRQAGRLRASRCSPTPTRRWRQAYGILGPLGFYRAVGVRRSTPTGVVRYAHRAIAGLTFRSTDELVRAVEGAATA